MPRIALVLALTMIAGCAAASSESPEPEVSPGSIVPAPWPEAPPVPTGTALEASVAAAVERLSAAGLSVRANANDLDALASSGDPRLAWLLADLLRLAVTPEAEGALVDAFAQLTGADPRDQRFGPNAWLAVTNLLIGWDLAAPPGYRELKAALLLPLEPQWKSFLADADSTIDWRVTTWGGAFMDDRPSGDTGSCDRACIPALDDPALTPADDGNWYPDDQIVFGIRIGDEAVALPKHIMEVHEMVNLTLGGRRLGIPYCTLCSSAQAYLTDDVPPDVGPLVLRTSGLLTRSNKLMYDLGTGSAFHTFTGRAASGPLRELDVALQQVTVIVATWAEWKAANPATVIVARDGGIGRAYPDDPLCGRDDAGPIFPIGPADTRLPAQTPVVGVIDSGGQPIAFAAELARAELAAGRMVRAGQVRVVIDGGGLGARVTGGPKLVTHEASWFAWSQFHPTTALWAPPLASPDPSPTQPETRLPSTLDDCQEVLVAPR